MSADSELEARQAKARITLSHYGILEDAYRPLWDKFGQQYFLRHEGPEIAWHTRMLLSHLNSASPVVRARLSPSGDGIQAMIYTKDRDDLFAHICSFFERMNYTIVEAKIHTTEHGYAINSFIVLDQSDKSVIYRDLLSFIEYELTVKLLSKNAPDAPSQGRVSRQVKHMPITPRVNLTPDTNGMSHTLELIASDRPGLLSRIAHVFLDHGVALHTAKINTLGNRAEDVFLISGKFGKKLSDNCAKTLGKDLLAKL